MLYILLQTGISTTKVVVSVAQDPTIEQPTEEKSSLPKCALLCVKDSRTISPSRTVTHPTILNVRHRVVFKNVTVIAKVSFNAIYEMMQTLMSMNLRVSSDSLNL